MSDRAPDPDEFLREIAERPPRLSRSALAPYTESIQKMWHGGHTFLEIQELLRVRTGVVRSVSTLQAFIAKAETQSRKQRRRSKRSAAVKTGTTSSTATMPTSKATPAMTRHPTQISTQPKPTGSDKGFEFDPSQPF